MLHRIQTLTHTHIHSHPQVNLAWLNQGFVEILLISIFFTNQTLNVLGVQHSPGLLGSPAAAAAAAAAAALWRHPELASQYITNAAAAAAAAAQVYHVNQFIC